MEIFEETVWLSVRNAHLSKHVLHNFAASEKCILGENPLESSKCPPIIAKRELSSGLGLLHEEYFDKKLKKMTFLMVIFQSTCQVINWQSMTIIDLT